MLPTTYQYGVFVVAVFIVYYAATRLTRGRVAQNLVLLSSSYVFYALWDWRWCLLLAAVSASGYFGALLLDRTERRRSLIMGLVLFLNLGTLWAFKYLVWNLEEYGIVIDWVTRYLVLPVGLSYFVFQNVSYVLDVYRREMRATAGIVEYAAALSCFPQLLAGPITRPRDLVPQLLLRREFDETRARDGLRQILWGLTKKMVIADSIGIRVDYVWTHVLSLDGITLVIAAILYSVQIYCDFSGYADIAIGTAKLFNLRLSPNFDYPYFSTSVQMFWRRWHITLASWMRDYVYIPLGGSRVGNVRHTFNLLVTFMLVGFWHGPSMTYVVWGCLHGTYLAVEARLRLPDRSQRTRPELRQPAFLSGVIVFALVTFAWVFFRAPTLHAATDYVSQALVHPAGTREYARYAPWLLLCAGLLSYEWLTRSWEHGLALTHVRLPARWAIYVGLSVTLLIFGSTITRGIYVQF